MTAPENQPEGSDLNSEEVGGQIQKRMAKPEEVGNMALFLLSDEASFCTGGVYNVDGGANC